MSFADSIRTCHKNADHCEGKRGGYMSIHTPAVELQDTHASTINIFINDVRYKVTERILTGAQIATLGGVPEGNQIFLEVPGPGEDRPIRPDEPVVLKSGMRFYDVPPGNLG